MGLSKNRKKGLRKIVEGKVCKFCGKPVGTHVAATKENGGACEKAIRVFEEGKQKFPHQTGAAWLYYVRGITKGEETEDVNTFGTSQSGEAGRDSDHRNLDA